MSKSKRFLPESIANALRTLVSMMFAASLLLLALALILALFLHNPWLAGIGTSSSFGNQSFIGNIIAAFIYAIGWLPTLFIFLYILRISFNMLAKISDPAPEYNAMRAVIAVAFGAAGLGTLAPNISMGGIAGVVIAHDIGKISGNFSFLFGLLFIAVFLVMAGMLLRIKWSYIVSLYKTSIHLVKTLASALHLMEYVRPDEEDEEEYEEEEEEHEEVEEEKVKRKREKVVAVPIRRKKSDSDFKLPDPKFLERADFKKQTVSPELKRNAANMESSFEQYGVIGEVRGIKPGPVVTLYEFEPVLGMRYKNIIDTVKDMTRAMETVNIRMAAIPGTKYVGVEMVNMKREEVRMQNMVTDDVYANSRFGIPLALGVNIGGNPVVIDLAKQPHMLIAGRTGSGKSVFMQSIIMSLLYRFTPDELKLVMVDPKTVEFALWSDIPHLMTPVVSDAQKSVNVRKWAVREMDARYQKFNESAGPNITG
jgi:ABC-type multidrug transport system fused ATPase/permease subunit